MVRNLSQLIRLPGSTIKFFLLIGSVFTLASATSLGDDNKPLTVEELSKIFEPREYIGTNKKPLKYRLLKPLGYEFGKKYPLLVFLHGAGERGNDNTVTLKHGAREFANEERRKMYPTYVLIPQCPTDAKWSDTDWSKDSSDLPEHASDSLQTLKELIDEMIENAGVDGDRILLTGLSMGGYGTWDAIARYPGFFAAAAPICGGGDPKTVERFAGLPIWCFHGEKDSVVKVNRSREMVEAIKKTNAQVRYTEYPGVDHDSWTETYANPEFYSWIFAQKKSKTIE